MNKVLLLILLFLISITVLFSQTKNNLIKIVADDRAEGDQFGWSTSIFRDYCVVGTPQRKAKSPVGNRLWQEGGGAYIFQKNTKGNWIQTQLLLPDKPKESDYFGTSVSMYDNFLAVGCNGDDTINHNSDFLNRMGAVYMYKLDKLGKWNKIQKITLGIRNSRDNFGDKVCLHKNRLAVGATQCSFPDSKFDGAVFIYEKTDAGGWVQKHVIKCPEKDMLFFGEEIAISDSLLVIGGRDSKNAFVYKLTKNEKWNLIKKLCSTDKSDIDFGSSVAIHNNIICVGANGSYENYDDNPDTLAFRKKHLLGAGSVYIYEIDANNTINFKQRITAKDIKADMHFGNCMSLSDSVLVVGAFGDALDTENLPNNRYGGAAYIFKKDMNGIWIETRKITSPQRSIWDKFAFSVSIYNQTVIIGSRFEKENSQEKSPVLNAGAVYIYEDK